MTKQQWNQRENREHCKTHLMIDIVYMTQWTVYYCSLILNTVWYLRFSSHYLYNLNPCWRWLLIRAVNALKRKNKFDDGHLKGYFRRIVWRLESGYASANQRRLLFLCGFVDSGDDLLVNLQDFFVEVLRLGIKFEHLNFLGWKPEK